MYVKGPIPLIQRKYKLKFRQEKEQDSDINNYMMQSAMMVCKMLSIKWQWETVHKRQQTISKYLDKPKINIVNHHTENISKP